MTWDLPLWQSLMPIGRHSATGAYRRFSFTEADSACRAWFINAAAERKLRVECDSNGNLWAWWDAAPDTGAVVTGSHLDSVPDGGAFDGPLGVVSAFAALDLLSERGWRPVRPVGVVAFVEEEGARFGLACLGSKLSTGVIKPDVARRLTDSDGISLAQAMAGVGLDPALIGSDAGLGSRVAAF